MSRRRKAVDKAVETSGAANLRPFAKGFDPRRNVTVPGPGAPPSAIRAAMREAYAARLPRLAQLADSKNPKVALAALQQLGRFGLGPARGVNEDDLRDRLRDTLVAIRELVPAAVQPQLEARLADIWLGRPVGHVPAGEVLG